MKKIIVTMWISLDGFIAGPNDAMDWLLVDDELGAYEDSMVTNADTLLLGRKTYESFAGSWPHVPENPRAAEAEKAYARKVNAMQKVVFSKTLKEAAWNNSTVLPEINPEEIRKLQDMPGKSMLIYGSASIIQQLTELGLIDEFQFLLHPVVLGSGKPLFKQRVSLDLISTKKFRSGVVLLTYRPQK